LTTELRTCPIVGRHLSREKAKALHAGKVGLLRAEERSQVKLLIKRVRRGSALYFDEGTGSREPAATEELAASRRDRAE
jgi:hypothetical protein